MSIKKNSEKIGEMVSRLLVIAFVLITIYPIIFVMITSLKSTQEFYQNVWLLPENIEWGNYLKAWVDANIAEYFINSSIVVFSTVILITVIGLMAGYSLARLDIPFSNLILLGFLAVAMIPHESLIMPLYMMLSKLGLIGEHTSLIIPYVGWGLPITIYIFKNFFHTIPNSLLESARIDGATEWTSFFKIMVPLVLPAVATTVILNFVAFWGELLWATTALSTSSVRTIPLGIINFQSQFATDWGTLSAAVCIVMVPLIVIFMVMQKYFIQGVTGGAVKG